MLPAPARQAQPPENRRVLSSRWGGGISTPITAPPSPSHWLLLRRHRDPDRQPGHYGDKYRHSRTHAREEAVAGMAPCPLRPRLPPGHTQGEALLWSPLLSTKLCLWGWGSPGRWVQTCFCYSLPVQPRSLPLPRKHHGKGMDVLWDSESTSGTLGWGGPGQARRVDQLMDGGHGDCGHGPKSGSFKGGSGAASDWGLGHSPVAPPVVPPSPRGLPWGGRGDRGSQRCENSRKSLRQPLPLSVPGPLPVKGLGSFQPWGL